MHFEWKRTASLLPLIGGLILGANVSQAATSAYQTEVLADNPFMYYRLDETSGAVANDFTVNSVDGSYQSTPILGLTGFGTGSDTAAEFDGSSQYISTTASDFTSFTSLMATSSYEFVFSTENINKGALFGTFNSSDRVGAVVTLNENAAGSSAAVANSVRIFLRDSNDDYIGAAFENSSVTDGDFHHLIYAFDANGATPADQIKAYFDGVEQPLSFITQLSGGSRDGDLLDWTAFDSGSAPAFAARNVRGTVGQHFDGVLDEAAIYGTTLAEADAVARATALGITIAQPNQWNVNGSGTFNDANNWTDVVIPTSSAVFGNSLTSANAPATVTLDSPVSLSEVKFQNSNQYIIDGPEALTLTGSATVEVGGTHQIVADIAGSAGLQKTGTGTLVLAAAKSYTGTTTVSEGTLQINNLDAVDNQASGEVSVGSTGTLLLSSGSNGTLAAQLLGSGLVNLDDSMEATDTVTLNRSNSSYSGIIRIDAGTLEVTHSQALGAGGTTANRTTLDDDSTAKIALAGGVSISDEVLDMDGRTTDAVGLTSAGNNAWNGVIDAQSNAASYQFNIESTSGTLTLGDLYAADIQDEGMNPVPQTFVFTGAGNTTVAGHISEDSFDDTSGTINPSVHDNIGVIKRGSGTLTIATGAAGGGGRIDNWFGPTRIEEGTLAVTDPFTANAGELRSASIAISDGATLDISTFATYSQQIDQTISGNGQIVASTLQLVSSGSLSPGDAAGQVGTLDVQGNMTVTALGGTGGVWSFDVGNNTDTTGDIIAVTGSVTTSGSPTISVNVSPAHGHLDAGSRTVISHSGGANSGLNGMTAQITDPNGNLLVTRQSVSINGSSSGQINVTVSGEEASRTWNGNVNGDWNTSTSNWQEGDQQFRDLDQIVFDDSASGTTDVALNANRFAGSVSFSNSSKDYTISGTGGLVGTGGVTVSGTGQVTFANVGNNYSGTTTVASGASLQITDATTGDVVNSGTLSLHTEQQVSALVQNGATSIGSGGHKVFAVEAENYQSLTNNGPTDSVEWNSIGANEEGADASLGGDALIAGPAANNNMSTSTSSQSYATYSMKFTEPGVYYWFGRMKAVDGGATMTTGSTPDGNTANDDSVWLPSSDLGNGVANPEDLSTRIDLISTAVNGEGLGNTDSLTYDWYRSDEGELVGGAGFEKIVVTAEDVAIGSVFQFKTATRESGAVIDKHVFVRNPDFDTDAAFGAITDADLDSAIAITSTSMETLLSAGTVLDVNGDFTMSGDSSILEILIGAPDVHDQVNVSGMFTADGTLDIGIGNGGLGAEAGDVFDIFSFDSVSGAFDNIILPSLALGLEWDTDNLLIDGELSVVAQILAGDYNSDGTVDAADYTVWRDNLGTDNVLPNDLIGGTISQTHYDQWVANYGNSYSSFSASQAVPEPGTALLLSFVIAAGVGSVNRRRA